MPAAIFDVSHVPMTGGRMTTSEEQKTSLEIQKLRIEVANLEKPFRQKLREQWQTTAIAALAGLVMIFPTNLAERVKSGLNRADQRFAQYRQLSEDLSEHAFNSEVVLECYENGWTTKEGLTSIVNDYNRTITTVMKREQLYAAVVKRYWKPDQVAQYQLVMSDIKKLDHAIHAFNSEAELVAEGKEPKAREAVVKPLVEKAKPLLDAVSKHTSELLDSLTP
jgi:hypothetical protein